MKYNSELTIYTGPMFSGKSTALLNSFWKIKDIINCQLFSSVLDKRYGENKVISHDRLEESAVCVKDTEELLKNVYNDVQAVFIDEAHLIQGNLYTLCQTLLNKGIDVYISALDLDYKAEPFMEIAKILCLADNVVKKKGKCTICKEHSRYSKRTVNNTDIILVGGKSEYVPVCLNHLR